MLLSRRARPLVLSCQSRDNLLLWSAHEVADVLTRFVADVLAQNNVDVCPAGVRPAMRNRCLAASGS